jgi:hypothetical protein
VPDTKLTALTADTSPTSDDLVYTVTDPAGTPASRKVTLANLASALVGFSQFSTRFAARAMVLPGVNDYTAAPFVNKTTATLAASRLLLVPLWIPEAISIDQLAAEPTATGGATASLLMCLYSSNSTTGRPASPVVNASIDTSTGQATGDRTGSVSASLSAGLYFIGGVAQGANGATPTYRTISLASWTLPSSAASSFVGSNTPQFAYYQDSVSGSLPDPFVPAGTTTTCPVVRIRRSA